VGRSLRVWGRAGTIGFGMMERSKETFLRVSWKGLESRCKVTLAVLLRGPTILICGRLLTVRGFRKHSDSFPRVFPPRITVSLRSTVPLCTEYCGSLPVSWDLTGLERLVRAQAQRESHWPKKPLSFILWSLFQFPF
jgi:hypothetical protein